MATLKIQFSRWKNNKFVNGYISKEFLVDDNLELLDTTDMLYPKILAITNAPTPLNTEQGYTMEHLLACDNREG